MIVGTMSTLHTSSRRAFLFALLTLAGTLTLGASTAQAEKADKEKPINYSADTGDVNYQTKIGTLSGNVVITQGTLTIHADKVVFKQNPDNSMSASAFGNPIAFRQKRDGVDEYFEGFAQHAEYDGTKQFLELFDRALLRRGTDEIRSNYITYNAQTELFKAETRPGSPGAPPEAAAAARVRGVFQPKSEGSAKGGKDEAKAPAPASAPATAPAPASAPAKDTAPLPLKPAGELAPVPAK
jgi:lipopolysaccharide export system protein LptA